MEKASISGNLSLLWATFGFLAEALHPFEQFILTLLGIIFLLIRHLRWHRLWVPLIGPRQPVLLVYIHVFSSSFLSSSSSFFSLYFLPLYRMQREFLVGRFSNVSWIWPKYGCFLVGITSFHEATILGKRGKHSPPIVSSMGKRSLLL